MKQLKIPDAEDLLLPKPEPKDLDPVQENVAASVGKPIGALPHQDHIAHLKVHLAFLQSPLFGKNPIIAPMFLPAIVAHIKDHLLMHYMKMTVKGIDLAEEHGMVNGDSEMSQADAAIEIMQTLEQAIPREFLGLVTQAFQEAQQYQPQQPQDPAQLAAQVQQASIDQRREASQQTVAIKQQELSLKQQDMQVRPQTEMAKETLKQDREDERTKAELLTKLEMNEQDNNTAKELAAVEVASGERIALSTGTGINPNP